MTHFSRKTIVELVNAMQGQYNPPFDRTMLEFGLEDEVQDSSLPRKLNRLAEYLIKNPNQKGPQGEDLVLELIKKELNRRSFTSLNNFEDDLPELANSLKRDGFTLSNGNITRALPAQIPVSNMEDELRTLLKKHTFSIPLGHFEQAINNHTNSNWASANSQLRTFTESLFDKFYEGLAGGNHSSSHQRRQELARITPPFLLESINEWSISNNNGFLEGLWRRLHTQGSHPGLSDEEDCTFRLHLVILVSHHLIKRFDSRTP